MTDSPFVTDPTIVVLEHDTHVAPLGLRFRDGATGRLIGGELQVSAAPVLIPRRRMLLAANRSGIYAVARLPGLIDAERDAGDAAFWSSPPALRRFTVEVTDPARRYLPCRFDLTLPAHGLALPDCIPPATPSDALPVSIELFSAPTRPVPAGMAALRVEVWEARTGLPDAPVPWALLEVDAHLPLPARGLTDKQGRGVVIFPYPEPTLFDTGSSPAGGRSLLTQSWNLTLRVFATPYDDWETIPDLCRVLGQADDAPRTEVIATLHYGEEAHIATPPHSTLLLPAGSPV